MKTSLLFLTFSGFLCSYGQITITNADVAPIGSTIIQATDTLPGVTIVPGPAGPNQTWNFSAAGNHFADTIKFTNPAWLQNHSSFPNSNLAIVFESEGAEGYLENTPSHLASLGQAGDFLGNGDTMAVPVTPREILMQWPANFNNSFTDQFQTDIKADGAAFGFDSIRLKSNTHKQVNVDAWGSLTTPLNTFNTLRTKTVSETVDSIWVYYAAVQSWAFIMESYDTTLSYSWWTNDANVGFPLFELDYDSANGGSQQARWLLAQPTTTTGIVDANENSNRVYPNPATSSEVIYFSQAPDYVKVMDLSGKLILETTHPGTSLRLGNMAAGIYLVQIKTGDVMKIEKLKIQ